MQIAARVVSGEVAGVIFLMDSLNPQSHESDHHALLRVCNLYDVPLAIPILPPLSYRFKGLLSDEKPT
ncbi:MAG: hypothetical protein AAGD25_07905 [Cyanobacteria bacterium P01_F01_bin.150]